MEPIKLPDTLNSSAPGGLTRFWQTIRKRWMAFAAWQQALIIAALCLLVATLLYGGWLIIANKGPSPTPAETETIAGNPEPISENPTPSAPQPEQPPAPNPEQPKNTSPAQPPPNDGDGSNNNDNPGNGGGNDPGNNDPPSFPNANNTGPSGCSSYTKYTGTLNVTTEGAILNCIELEGTLTINASNVTVQNAILKGDSWWGVRVGNTNSATTNFKLLHSRLYTTPGQGPDNGGYDYGVSQESSGYMEIGYNDISGYKDGVTTANGYIHDNYIHNLSQFTGAHTQDIYVYTGPSQVKIEHNTLINDSPQSQATAAIYIAPDDGQQNNRIVHNNFLAGGAYTIYGGDSTATNIVVTDNKFSTQIWPDSGYFGWAAYWWPNNTGNIWSGNTWADGNRINQTINP